MKQNLINKTLVLGITLALIAEVANANSRPNDNSQVIYLDTLSEVNVKKEKELTFDKDLKTLSKLQGKYTENLPKLFPTKKRTKNKIKKPQGLAKK